MRSLLKVQYLLMPCVAIRVHRDIPKQLRLARNTQLLAYIGEKNLWGASFVHKNCPLDNQIISRDAHNYAQP